MDITFCEKCRGIMMPAAGGLRCRKCGYEVAKQASMEFKTEQPKKEIIVLENDEAALPTIERSCPSCGNETAYFWLIQTRSSDEPPTRFFRCTECKHTWREYS